ncbi:unnamed protein product [Amoebophrya sp. A120]|nr:unnamed protein product [Amoebophrya sp. A120]|eukprot:GSA120T00013803001.1
MAESILSAGAAPRDESPFAKAALSSTSAIISTAGATSQQPAGTTSTTMSKTSNTTTSHLTVTTTDISNLRVFRFRDVGGNIFSVFTNSESCKTVYDCIYKVFGIPADVAKHLEMVLDDREEDEAGASGLLGPKIFKTKPSTSSSPTESDGDTSKDYDDEEITAASPAAGAAQVDDQKEHKQTYEDLCFRVHRKMLSPLELVLFAEPNLSGIQLDADQVTVLARDFAKIAKVREFAVTTKHKKSKENHLDDKAAALIGESIRKRYGVKVKDLLRSVEMKRTRENERNGHDPSDQDDEKSDFDSDVDKDSSDEDEKETSNYVSTDESENEDFLSAPILDRSTGKTSSNFHLLDYAPQIIFPNFTDLVNANQPLHPKKLLSALWRLRFLLACAAGTLNLEKNKRSCPSANNKRFQLDAWSLRSLLRRVEHALLQEAPKRIALDQAQKTGEVPPPNLGRSSAGTRSSSSNTKDESSSGGTSTSSSTEETNHDEDDSSPFWSQLKLHQQRELLRLANFVLLPKSGHNTALFRTDETPFEPLLEVQEEGGAPGSTTTNGTGPQHQLRRLLHRWDEETDRPRSNHANPLDVAKFLDKANELGLEFCRAWLFANAVLVVNNPKDVFHWFTARTIAEHHLFNLAVACLELVWYSPMIREMLQRQTWSWCEHLPEFYLQMLRNVGSKKAVAVGAEMNKNRDGSDFLNANATTSIVNRKDDNDKDSIIVKTAPTASDFDFVYLRTAAAVSRGPSSPVKTTARNDEEQDPDDPSFFKCSIESKTLSYLPERKELNAADFYGIKPGTKKLSKKKLKQIEEERTNPLQVLMNPVWRHVNPEFEYSVKRKVAKLLLKSGGSSTSTAVVQHDKNHSNDQQSKNQNDEGSKIFDFLSDDDVFGTSLGLILDVKEQTIVMPLSSSSSCAAPAAIAEAPEQQAEVHLAGYCSDDENNENEDDESYTKTRKNLNAASPGGDTTITTTCGDGSNTTAGVDHDGTASPEDDDEDNGRCDVTTGLLNQREELQVEEEDNRGNVNYNVEDVTKMGEGDIEKMFLDMAHEQEENKEKSLLGDLLDPENFGNHLDKFEKVALTEESVETLIADCATVHRKLKDMSFRNNYGEKKHLQQQKELPAGGQQNPSAAATTSDERSGINGRPRAYTGSSYAGSSDHELEQKVDFAEVDVPAKNSDENKLPSSTTLSRTSCTTSVKINHEQNETTRTPVVRSSATQFHRKAVVEALEVQCEDHVKSGDGDGVPPAPALGKSGNETAAAVRVSGARPAAASTRTPMLLSKDDVKRNNNKNSRREDDETKTAIIQHPPGNVELTIQDLPSELPVVQDERKQNMLNILQNHQDTATITSSSSSGLIDRKKSPSTDLHLISNFALNSTNEMVPSALGIAVDQYVELSKEDPTIPSENLKAMLEFYCGKNCMEYEWAMTCGNCRCKCRSSSSSPSDEDADDQTLAAKTEKNVLQEKMKRNEKLNGDMRKWRKKVVIEKRKNVYLEIIKELLHGPRSEDLDLKLHLDHSQFFPLKNGHTLREFLVSDLVRKNYPELWEVVKDAVERTIGTTGSTTFAEGKRNEVLGKKKEDNSQDHSKRAPVSVDDILVDM